MHETGIEMGILCKRYTYNWQTSEANEKLSRVMQMRHMYMYIYRNEKRRCRSTEKQ